MSHAVNRVVPSDNGFQLEDKHGRRHGKYKTAEEAEQDSRLQSILAGRPWEPLAPENPPFKPELNFGGILLRSNMPKGGTLSPKGDLGALRQREAMNAFKKPIKGAGRVVRAKDSF